MRIVSWNVRQLDSAWRLLGDDRTIDVALLQEAKPPPVDVNVETHPPRSAAWQTAGHRNGIFSTAIARLSDRVVVRPIPTVPVGAIDGDVLQVSREGTLAAAEVEHNGATITVASVYSFWEQPLARTKSGWIYADASAHRLVSDLARLIGTERGHRLIVAGDWNLVRGYGEEGSGYWKRRYESVFARLEAMGLVFVGPQAPNGRQADPWPTELPRDSKNVPTYYSNRATPATATRQLDFVFASEALAPRVQVQARNGVEDWGPSDHCRVVIDIA